MGFWIFMLVMNLLIPITMIGFGKMFMRNSPRAINGIFGYRTANSMKNMDSRTAMYPYSMKNMDTWQFAHKYFGKRWYKLGWLILLPSILGMIPVIGKDDDIVGIVGSVIITIQCVVLILPIFSTEKALKRTFDKDGKRINKEEWEDEKDD